jgi:hypothetical protein
VDDRKAPAAENPLAGAFAAGHTFSPVRCKSAAATVLFAVPSFVLFCRVPVVADTVVKNSVVRQCGATVEYTAAEPLGVRKIRPEAITPLRGKEPAAVAIAADSFFWYERIIRVTAVKTWICYSVLAGVTRPVGVGMITATAHIYPHSAACVII